MISNACYAVRDSHRGQRSATPDSLLTNTRYAIGSAVVGDGFRDDGGSNRRHCTTHLHSIRFGTAGNFVVQITYLEVVCPEACCCHEGEEKEEKFSHNCLIFKG